MENLQLGDNVAFPRGMSYPISRYVQEGDTGQIIEVGASQYRVHLHKNGRVIWAPSYRVVPAETYIPIKKVQCRECFHWKYPEKIFPSGECEDCHEEEDEAPYLWAQWRIDRGS